MKRLIVILLFILFSAPVLADKPADKGAGKPAMEHQQGHMQAPEKNSSGLEKQKTMKQEQIQKESGKGSEQGQTMREEHRKKWWKFWE